jgi:hypothetical protein
MSPRPPGSRALLRALNRHARDLTVRISLELCMVGTVWLVPGLAETYYTVAMPKGKTFPIGLSPQHWLAGTTISTVSWRISSRAPPKRRFTVIGKGTGMKLDTEQSFSAKYNSRPKKPVFT